MRRDLRVQEAPEDRPSDREGLRGRDPAREEAGRAPPLPHPPAPHTPRRFFAAAPRARSRLSGLQPRARRSPQPARLGVCRLPTSTPQLSSRRGRKREPARIRLGRHSATHPAAAGGLTSGLLRPANQERRRGWGAAPPRPSRRPGLAPTRPSRGAFGANPPAFSVPFFFFFPDAPALQQGL